MAYRVEVREMEVRRCLSSSPRDRCEVGTAAAALPRPRDRKRLMAPLNGRSEPEVERPSRGLIEDVEPVINHV